MSFSDAARLGCLPLVSVSVSLSGLDAEPDASSALVLGSALNSPSASAPAVVLVSVSDGSSASVLTSVPNASPASDFVSSLPSVAACVVPPAQACTAPAAAFSPSKSLVSVEAALSANIGASPAASASLQSVDAATRSGRRSNSLVTSNMEASTISLTTDGSLAAAAVPSAMREVSGCPAAMLGFAVTSAWVAPAPACDVARPVPSALSVSLAENRS